MIQLRISRLLCIKTYLDKEYPFGSGECDFVSVLNNLVSGYKANSVQKIQVVIGYDDVCKKCRFNQRGICFKISKKQHLEKIRKERLLLENPNLKVQLNHIYDIKTLFKDLIKQNKEELGLEIDFCNEFCENKGECMFFKNQRRD